MILDKNEIDSHFYNNLMRMHTCEETRHIQDNIDNEIMFEVELSNLDSCENDFNMGKVTVPEKKVDPIIAIIRRSNSDNRRSWMVDKLVVGARSCFSA